jgi:AraC family transcriptional regulator
MQHRDGQSACGNPVFEHSLLTPQDCALWQGAPVGWIDSSPHHVEADLVTERTRLVMIDSGATHADFRYGNRSMSWEFTPGSIGVFTVGTELKLSRWKWTRTRRIYLDLDTALPEVAALLEPMRSLPSQTEIEFRDPELSCVLRTMVQEVAAGSPHGRLFAESLSVGVALRLHQRAASRYGGSRERGKLTGGQVQKVRELVEAHLGGNVALAELARCAGFSAPQFLRLFKNTFGCTPHQYVLKARLERARALVVAGGLPLAAIAAATGFASQSHMTAAFVRAFQTPPGEMRRRARVVAAGPAPQA